MKFPRIIGISIGIASALLLMVFLIALPQLQKLQHDAAGLRRVHAKLAEAEQHQQILERFSEFSDLHRVERAKFENVFIDPGKPIDFLEDVERIAAELDLRLSIVPGTPQQTSQYQWSSVEFQLFFEGPFPTVSAFLQQLENAPYAIEFANVALVKSQTNPRNVASTIVMKTYTK